MKHNKNKMLRVITECISTNGAWQMALDNYLAERMGLYDYKAVFRTFTWSPMAVSLGVNQQVDNKLLYSCPDTWGKEGNTEGLEIVRRPTGGRMLLHYGDLSFCVVLRTEDSSINEFSKVYNKTANAIVNMLQELGIRAEIGRNTISKLSKNVRGTICMLSPTRGEILVGGEKDCCGITKIVPKFNPTARFYPTDTHESFDRGYDTHYRRAKGILEE